MAATFPPSLILVLQLLSLTTTSLFLRTNGSVLVNNVCTQTRDPSLCTMSLGSDPRSGSATLTLPDLAERALQVAQVKGAAAKKKIHSYLLQATDPMLRDLYVQCDNLYYDALELLFRGAPGELQGHQYGELNQLAVRVRGQVDGCEAAFNNNSPFKIENQVVGVLADAIAVIAINL